MRSLCLPDVLTHVLLLIAEIMHLLDLVHLLLLHVTAWARPPVVVGWSLLSISPWLVGRNTVVPAHFAAWLSFDSTLVLMSPTWLSYRLWRISRSKHGMIWCLYVSRSRYRSLSLVGALRDARVCRPPSVDFRGLLPSLRLITTVPHALSWMLPAVWVNVDVYDCIATLSRDLVLCLGTCTLPSTWRQAVNLDLVLLSGMWRCRGGHNW